jgi:hypothetical protein
MVRTKTTTGPGGRRMVCKIDPQEVTRVLLPGGWHECVPRSFQFCDINFDGIHCGAGAVFVADGDGSQVFVWLEHVRALAA